MHGVLPATVVAAACLGRRAAWPAVALPPTLHVRGRIDPSEVRVSECEHAVCGVVFIACLFDFCVLLTGNQ